MSTSEVSVIVLAAGNSSRMGNPKQMLDIGGRTLLEHSIRCAVDSKLGNILVVLGSEANKMKDGISQVPVKVVVNNDWAFGMGNSLKFGVRNVLKNWPNTHAIVIMVCDQPNIGAQHISALVAEWRRTQPKAVASAYAGALGVPVVFDRSVFTDLMNIENSSGARELIRRLGAQVGLVPFVGGEVDLDTKQDYQAFKAKQS